MLRPGFYLALLVIWPALGHADEEWQLVLQGPIVIKNRARAGSPIKDVWAEGELQAPAFDIQEALNAPEGFPAFMPYVTRAYRFGKQEADGSIYVHTLLSLPIVSRRDYVERVWVDERATPDGKGRFRQRWSAVPTLLPETSGTVRVRLNEGSWDVTPRGDGSRSWVVYKFTFDPGGSIPSFAVSLGNKSGVLDSLKAVEREAQRRFQARRDAPSTPPASADAATVAPAPLVGGAPNDAGVPAAP